MKNSIILTAFTLILVSITLAACQRDENEIDGYFSERPRGRCVSGQDCQRNECSVMGMQRFSEPRCELLGGLGAPCRVGAEADNKTLYFPHLTLECENVYMQFCPCAKGLVCEQAECKRARNRPAKFNRRFNSWATMRIH